MSEKQKQIIDQSGHFVLGLVATAMILQPERPLQGHEKTLVAFGVGLWVALILREYLQWPSQRWYDPFLDWTVYALGGGVAVFMF